MDIAELRLRNQRLIGSQLDDPVEVVQWLGAVQAQDYPAAKWGLALRLIERSDAAIEEAFNSGRILRTHMMRPTWHFVAPDDIRWIQKLTSPRVHSVNAYYYRKCELDEATFKQAEAIMVRALEGGNCLTRTEMADVLRARGIEASGIRLAYLLGKAELDALICSGPRKGKQFTYALLEERVLPAKEISREEALAVLTRRYFTSHGPAMLQDFTWWSGLTLEDAKLGVHLNSGCLVQYVVDSKTFWTTTFEPPELSKASAIHLLPNYDEHIVAYRDHSLSFDAEVLKGLDRGDRTLWRHIVTRDGNVVGGWRPIIGKKDVEVEVKLLTSISGSESSALRAAAEEYARFLGRGLIFVQA